MRVFVHLDLHTYTPRQLSIWARNRSDVCSQNRQNPRESNSTATVMSQRQARTCPLTADRRCPRQSWSYCCRMYMCPLYSTMTISTRLSLVLIYLFTAICSVHIVLLFMLGHHDGSVSES